MNRGTPILGNRHVNQVLPGWSSPFLLAGWGVWFVFGFEAYRDTFILVSQIESQEPRAQMDEKRTQKMLHCYIQGISKMETIKNSRFWWNAHKKTYSVGMSKQAKRRDTPCWTDQTKFCMMPPRFHRGAALVSGSFSGIGSSANSSSGFRGDFLLVARPSTTDKRSSWSISGSKSVGISSRLPKFAKKSQVPHEREYRGYAKKDAWKTSELYQHDQPDNSFRKPSAYSKLYHRPTNQPTNPPTNQPNNYAKVPQYQSTNNLTPSLTSK